MSTIAHSWPPCPLLWAVHLIVYQKPNQSLKKYVTFIYSVWQAIPPSVSLSLLMPPTHSLCDTQQIACKTVHIFSCALIIICIQRGLMGEKQQGKSNQNLLSLFSIMWLAWIIVPPAPISFPRLQHTGSIVQLTKWPLNHVITLSVYHWQK